MPEPLREHGRGSTNEPGRRGNGAGVLPTLLPKRRTAGSSVRQKVPISRATAMGREGIEPSTLGLI